MILVVFLWFPVLLWSFALLCHALLLMLSYCVNFPTFQCFSVPFPSPILSLSAWLQLYLNHLLVCSEARASFCLCQFFSVLPLCNPPVCFSSPVKCLPVFSIVSLFCPVVCFCYFFLLFLIGCTLLLVVGTLFSLLCCYFDFWCLLFLVSVFVHRNVLRNLQYEHWLIIWPNNSSPYSRESLNSYFWSEIVWVTTVIALHLAALRKKVPVC